MPTQCVVILDRFGDYHADTYTGLALPAAKRLVESLGLDDLEGEVFQYTIVETDDPGAARLMARGMTVVGQFRMEE